MHIGLCRVRARAFSLRVWAQAGCLSDNFYGYFIPSCCWAELGCLRAWDFRGL